MKGQKKIPNGVHSSILPAFTKTIRDYYSAQGRKLPWRETKNPYRIFVSEVMLQQTQVSRVIKKYPEFIKKFPDFHSLANASLRDVLEVWQGMGYNRRGKYLKGSAQVLVDVHKGIVPLNIEKIDDLPGIGYATACSVLCFSYNMPVVFIETNIRRVFIHFFFKDRKTIDDNEIYPLIEETLDRKNPREWYYALMDYGAFLGKLKDNPNKKSAHYTVQSIFEGSARQLRGNILKQLLNNKELDLPTLVKKTNSSEKKVVSVLKILKKEKMIRFKQGRYFL